MSTRATQSMKRVSAAVLAAAALTAAAPVSAAQAEVAQVAGDKVITTFASGAVGDTFECGGAIGRLWCK